MRNIEKWQIGKIHLLKNLLVLDDNVYIALLSGQFDKSTSKDLTYSEAQDLIALMEKKAVDLGVWKTKKEKRLRYEDLHDRPDMANPRQLRMIESMWIERSFQKRYEEKLKALDKFLSRIVKVERIEDLKKEDVNKVVAALKGMKVIKRRTYYAGKKI